MTTTDREPCPCGTHHPTYLEAAECWFPARLVSGPGGRWANATCRFVGLYRNEQIARMAEAALGRELCGPVCVGTGTHQVVRLPWCPMAYPLDVLLAGNVSLAEQDEDTP